MLADMGAEVIHIEHPVTGDGARGAMSFVGVITSIRGRNFYFEANNRNKMGMTLDITTQKGKEIVYKLVEKSDVFVQNMRKGVAEKRGLDYQTLKKYNPRLIYASAAGYGPRGPDSWLPSLDLSAQARSGLMCSIGGKDMPPLAVTTGIADQMGAIMLAYGILLAIIARERFGVGQEVNTSHLGSMVMLQGLNIAASLILGTEIPRLDREKPGNHLWNWYECQDGEWICLASSFDYAWPWFLKAVGWSELENDPTIDTLEKRFRNEELRQKLDELFATKPRAEWLKILREAGIICDPVNKVSDLANDPQVLENGYIREFDHPSFGRIKTVGIPVELSETPGSLRTAAPEFGQHTEEILTNVCGLNWDEITVLKDEGII
jgi:crotonobetainyl-CoA:carnitine CoA-transferase CaiB-like acyl-CoA transferase